MTVHGAYWSSRTAFTLHYFKRFYGVPRHKLDTRAMVAGWNHAITTETMAGWWQCAVETRLQTQPKDLGISLATHEATQTQKQYSGLWWSTHGNVPSAMRPIIRPAAEHSISSSSNTNLLMHRYGHFFSGKSAMQRKRASHCAIVASNCARWLKFYFTSVSLHFSLYSETRKGSTFLLKQLIHYLLKKKKKVCPVSMP